MDSSELWDKFGKNKSRFIDDAGNTRGLCVLGSDLDYTPTRVSANPHEFLCQMFYKRP